MMRKSLTSEKALSGRTVGFTMNRVGNILSLLESSQRPHMASQSTTPTRSPLKPEEMEGLSGVGNVHAVSTCLDCR